MGWGVLGDIARRRLHSVQLAVIGLLLAAADLAAGAAIWFARAGLISDGDHCPGHAPMTPTAQAVGSSLRSTGADGKSSSKTCSIADRALPRRRIRRSTLTSLLSLHRLRPLRGGIPIGHLSRRTRADSKAAQAWITVPLLADLAHRRVVDPHVDRRTRFPSAACTSSGVRCNGSTAPL